MRKRRSRKRGGWRVEGNRVYHVKGKKPSKRKTYRTKSAALRHKRKKRR